MLKCSKKGSAFALVLMKRGYWWILHAMRDDRMFCKATICHSSFTRPLLKTKSLCRNLVSMEPQCVICRLHEMKRFDVPKDRNAVDQLKILQATLIELNARCIISLGQLCFRDEPSKLLGDVFPCTRCSTSYLANIIKWLCSAIIVDIMTTTFEISSLSKSGWPAPVLRSTMPRVCTKGI